ncbi:phosphate propanoyltransferase [Paenibacillus ehimensis]|uniref:Phosphate propanoyltransferase n=1 Tax=Paenibacillus ehimensis TaxID=79264 RepID=A0ABT8VAC2_9BACL|nr:phosphate propanoyltransferase [Paenibacillus ehimensis]MDO3677919.1 phosphate propanoyltransferase [Paenibacillus ehimensis]
MALITETSLRSRLAQGLPNPYPIAAGDLLTPAANDFLKSRGIAIQRLKAEAPAALPAEPAPEAPLLPVGVSGRHVHLSPEHVEALFGEGYQLTPLKELSQPGQFAAQETVTLIGPKGVLQNVRILGPSRGASQVEISRTDGFALGVKPPVRLSGDLEGTPGITVAGPKGAVVLAQGLIVAKNHVHMSPDDARRFQVSDGDRIILQTRGDRPLAFTDVVVRVNPRYALDVHLDTDEANAAQLNTGDTVQMIGKNGVFTRAERG